MGPLLLAMLVAYYMAYRFGDDLLSAGSRLVATAADKAAGAADWIDRRIRRPAGSTLSTVDDAGEATTTARPASPTTEEQEGQPTPRSTAAKLRDRLRAVAQRLRTRPAPTQPRTAAGQNLLWEAGVTAAAGLLTWARLCWVDAKAAADSARQRRRDQQQRGTGGRGSNPNAGGTSGSQSRSRWGVPPWMSWPTGDDPQAPIKVTAERLDRQPGCHYCGDPNPVCYFSSSPYGEGGVCLECWNKYHRGSVSQSSLRPLAEPPAPTVSDTEQSQSPGDGVIDAEVVDDTPSAFPGAHPQLSVTPVAALPSGSHESGGHMSVDTAVAESGLGAYLAYSADMASSCDNAVNSAEATLAALSDQDWSGVPCDAIRDAMEHLGAAREAFNQAHSAFEAALAVREQYQANAHAGTKDSVMSD